MSDEARLLSTTRSFTPPIASAFCTRCPAWRGELGSEPTADLFIAHLAEVFREVRRVLKADGLAFVNIGDSYHGSGKGPSNSLQRPASCLNNRQLQAGAAPTAWVPLNGAKPKSLALIPERLAIALDDDGWYVRSRIAWCKQAPMPESVRDRPTNAWEHIWMLAKSRSYYYDADTVRQPNTVGSLERHGSGPETPIYDRKMVDHRSVPPGASDRRHQGTLNVNGLHTNGANLRSYWVLPPDPYPEAHFATFPREIPRRCILAGSRPGDVVLDPFAGSGTTLLVANQLGRVAWGIELNPAYCDLAIARLGQDLLFMAEPEPARALGLGERAAHTPDLLSLIETAG